MTFFNCPRNRVTSASHYIYVPFTDCRPDGFIGPLTEEESYYVDLELERCQTP